MPSFRGKALLALYMALGFVFLRVIYSIVFGTSHSGETVLLDLPLVGLSGPFEHITLFGPITLEGLAQSAGLALPFAFAILLFGVLASAVRPIWLLKKAKALPFGSNLLSALAIALMQIPALLESTKRISLARRLRGESRLRAIIPIFETAIARSNSIGLRLFLESTVQANARLSLKDFVPEGACHRPVSVYLEPGHLLVLKGPTGSGKTGILEALAGLTGEFRGRGFLGSIPKPSSVGFLPQNPRDLLFGSIVADELAQDVGLPFGLLQKLSRPISSLSEGEAVQVWIAKLLQDGHSSLLLDEPFASLDKASAIELSQLISKELKLGKAIAIAEHRFENMPKDARILDLGGAEPNPNNGKPSVPVQSNQEVETVKVVFQLSLPELKNDNQVLLKNIELEVLQGSAIALLGANGSGKTTLLRKLVSGSKPSEIAMVPEVVDDFFVCQSLESELDRADRVAKVPAGFTQKTLESFLPNASSLLLMHPRDLSFGQKLALACSMQLSHKPKLLLIDEPVKGFDQNLRLNVKEILRCVLETGTALVFATHDHDFASGLASEEWQIQDLKLIMRQVKR